LQDPPKFTQIGIFGLKTNHLATLDKSREQGDRIGRIFAYWAIVYVLVAVFGKLQKLPKFFGKFFPLTAVYTHKFPSNGLKDTMPHKNIYSWQSLI
jgi:hypothetical protein